MVSFLFVFLFVRTVGVHIAWSGGPPVLINTNVLTLFGAGSDWFWSMCQLIVVAVSVIGLYRQLRLQSSAGASEQATALASDWNSELLHRSRLATLPRQGVYAADGLTSAARVAPCRRSSPRSSPRGGARNA